MSEYRQRFANITTATTTVVKSGAGRLIHIVVNKPVSASTITIYNNTAASGTKIGTITNSTVVTPYCLDYDARFDTGLTIVTSGADDITVVYA